jgi:oxaloacetate decarboxylase alpha subunit
MTGRHIRLIDTTLRDGQASLWASRMRVGAMLPALGDLDAAGFDSLEFVAPNSQFVRWARDLRENPWDWVDNAAARVGRTELRIHGGIGGVGAGIVQIPECVALLLLERLVSQGITLTRTSDLWHNFGRMRASNAKMEAIGFRTIPTIIYSISPHHTAEFFRAKARALRDLKPRRVCLKDVGGLLKPDAAREIMSMMVEELPGVELEFHEHCGGGFGTLCAAIAAEVGFTYIHTGVPPLANGGAQPSVFTVAGNLRALGFAVDIDLEPLRRVSEHLYAVAAAEGYPIGEPVEYDEYNYQHQLPGGMIAHFQYQLSQLGLSHLWSAVVEEARQVRADLGYPIVMTPYASWIASQAALNVMNGKRWSVVSDQMIMYAFGFGIHKEGSELMDQDLRDRILAMPRAAELKDWKPWEPELRDLRKLYDCFNDDELILRVYAGDSARDVMSAPRKYPRDYKGYALQTGSLGAMLGGYVRSKAVKTVSVRRRGLSGQLRRVG